MLWEDGLEKLEQLGPHAIAAIANEVLDLRNYYSERLW